MEQPLEAGDTACICYYMTELGDVEMSLAIKVSEIKDITVVSTADNITATINDYNSATNEAGSKAAISGTATYEGKTELFLLQVLR